MPPLHRDEGLRAALTLRSVIRLSECCCSRSYVETRYANRLAAPGLAGFDYLLKERVVDVDDFIDALYPVAGGGTALDPEVVTKTAGRPAHRIRPVGTDLARTSAPCTDGAGPHARSDRRGARRLPTPGGEAHCEHLHQARPSPRRGRPPLGFCSAAVSAGRRAEGESRGLACEG